MEPNTIIGLRTQSTYTYKYPRPAPRSCALPNKNAQLSTNMARRYTARRRTYRPRARQPTRRRAPYRKRTPYRRRTYAKRPSRKTILNLTATKKSDTMLSVSNTSPTGISAAIDRRGLFVQGNTGYAMCLWNATARNMATGGAGANLFMDKADRTSTTCYMRGLREVLRVQTSSPLPWVWRRICYTTKDDIFLTSVAGDTAPTQSHRVYFDDQSDNRGMERLWFNASVNSTPNTLGVFLGIIFQGEQGKDWNNVLNAKTDSTRIRTWSDTQVPLHTGNQSGYFKTHKRWYPMDKNLVYADDESGAAEASSYITTAARPGMGDYYVLDLFVPGIGGTATDLLTVDSQASLYWHEK